MDLYSDLPATKDGTNDGASKKAASSFVPANLVRKRPAAAPVKPAVVPKPVEDAATIALGAAPTTAARSRSPSPARRGLRYRDDDEDYDADMTAGASSRAGPSGQRPPASTGAPVPYAARAHDASFHVADDGDVDGARYTFPLGDAEEYDPSRPNEYGAVLAQRAAQREADARAAELEAEMAAMAAQRESAAAAARHRLAMLNMKIGGGGGGTGDAAASRDDDDTAMAMAGRGGSAGASSSGGTVQQSSGVPISVPPAIASVTSSVAAGGSRGVGSGGRGRGMEMTLPAWMLKPGGAAAAAAAAAAGASGTVPGASAAMTPLAAVAASLPATAPAAVLPSAATSTISSGSSSGGGGVRVPPGISSKVGRMMEKWGYTTGKGLGKDESGITAPLVHVKTGATSGVIRLADGSAYDPRHAGASSGAATSATAAPEPAHLPGLPALLSTVAASNSSSGGVGGSDDAAPAPGTSRVVLVRNMCGPGEVDDDLEEEVKEEATAKYGPVGAVIVYEVLGVPDTEAVRIFIAFTDAQAAQRAAEGLNRRFFGGRQLKARLYDEQRFLRHDLAPSAADLAPG